MKINDISSMYVIVEGNHGHNEFRLPMQILCVMNYKKNILELVMLLIYCANI